MRRLPHSSTSCGEVSCCLTQECYRRSHRKMLPNHLRAFVLRLYFADHLIWPTTQRRCYYSLTSVCAKPLRRREAERLGAEHKPRLANELFSRPGQRAAGSASMIFLADFAAGLVFHSKILLQDRSGTAIAHSLDPQHPSFWPSPASAEPAAPVNGSFGHNLRCPLQLHGLICRRSFSTIYKLLHDSRPPYPYAAL